MRLLFFGTYDKRSHPRVRVLMEGLREQGHEVDECNVPLGLETEARVEMLRRPILLTRLVARLLSAWGRLLWRSARVERPDAIIVGYLGQLDVHLARLRWPRVPRALDDLAPIAGTAEDRGLGGGMGARALAAVDHAAASAATLVITDTDEHTAMLPAAYRDRAVRVPVGAPRAWFSEPGPPADDLLRVVFFGLYTPLQGAPVIGEAIAELSGTHPGIRFTMIGRGQELEETKRAAGDNPGVRWIDWVEAEELPGVVAAHDVCLGIFGTGGKTRRVVPNKVYQGAAAGCVIVTADTPPQRLALGALGALVPAGDAGALAARLRELAEDPDRVRRLRADTYRHALASFAPDAVTVPLAKRLAAKT